jgi:DNA-binding NtrC family response regulator
MPGLKTAIMTAHASVDSAVEAVRLRADDYILKPFNIATLKNLLQRMYEKTLPRAAVLRVNGPATHPASAGFIGSSRKTREMLRLIDRIKDIRIPILLTGESGTGKEVVTRAIHESGSHPERPFVVVDCGSLVPSLVESELFGHEKGAFTGASGSKPGLFMAANGGTIFLDEIGELPLEMQTKLLRVLQQKEVRPVGGNRLVKIDVRVIAATNRDLECECEKGRFRKDLFFRLNVIRIHIPPLRNRREDIPELVDYFVAKANPMQPARPTSAALAALMHYGWPGNVRELENCIDRALALGDRRTIDLEDLPLAIQRALPGPRCIERPAGLEFSRPAASGFSNSVLCDMSDMLPTPLKTAVPVRPMPGDIDIPSIVAVDSQSVERRTILEMLEETNGDKNLAGKMLGVSRATLYRRLKRHSIGPVAVRAASDA